MASVTQRLKTRDVPSYISLSSRLHIAAGNGNFTSRPTEEFLNRHETPGMRPDRGMFILRDCVIVNTQCSEAMNCYLSVETLLIASDKCPDLYLSIGRSIYWEEKGFSDNRGKTSMRTRNQRTWLYNALSCSDMSFICRNLAYCFG